MRSALAAVAAAAVACSAAAAPVALVSVWGNGARDTLACGPGHDVVNVDPGDAAGAACETVLQRIAGDATTTPGAQHATIVEPHVAVDGSMAVAVFQAGRFRSGGAAAIGVAVSRDGGARWRTSLLRPLAGLERISDPVVAHDRAHGVWLLTAVAVSPGGASALLLSRSTDGVDWSVPAPIARHPAFRFDKEWIACDGWDGSPFRGRCYLAYTDTVEHTVAVRSSDDGGRRWSEPARIGSPVRNQVGAIPVSRPDGTVLVVWLRERRAQMASLSADGGATFGPPSRIATVTAARTGGVRAVEIPSAAAAPDGTVAVVWHGCIGPPCRRNAVMRAASADGVRWSPPAPIASVPGTVFTPALAISPADGSAAAVFYGLHRGSVDGWLVRTAGDRWTAPSRLSARSMPLAWIAATTSGAMLGDYVGIAYAGTRPLAVLPLAGPPGDAALRQPLFATLRVG